jgi:hypothetical protein
MWIKDNDSSTALFNHANTNIPRYVLTRNHAIHNNRILVVRMHTERVNVPSRVGVLVSHKRELRTRTCVPGATLPLMKACHDCCRRKMDATEYMSPQQTKQKNTDDDDP